MLNVLSENECDVLLLNETWLQRSFSFKLKNYVSIRQDRYDSYGGLLTAVNVNYKPTLLSNLSYSPIVEDDLEILTISISPFSDPSNKVCIVNVYENPTYAGDFAPLVTVLNLSFVCKVILCLFIII